MKALFSLLVLLGMSVSLCGAQTKKFVGINDVAAAGQIIDGKYKNSFLGLTVEAPNSTQTLNPVVAESAQRARLVQILAKQTGWENTYTFAVLADLLSVNPLTKTPADYISNLRRNFEHTGLPTVREEFPIKIAGQDFVGVVLQEQVPNGKKYYRGFYTTFRKGYIVTFDVEAPSPEKLTELVTTLVKFN